MLENRRIHPCTSTSLLSRESIVSVVLGPGEDEKGMYRVLGNPPRSPRLNFVQIMEAFVPIIPCQCLQTPAKNICQIKLETVAFLS